jgi:hypothetical protein
VESGIQMTAIDPDPTREGGEFTSDGYKDVTSGSQTADPEA